MISVYIPTAHGLVKWYKIGGLVLDLLAVQMDGLSVETGDIWRRMVRMLLHISPFSKTKGNSAWILSISGHKTDK